MHKDLKQERQAALLKFQTIKEELGLSTSRQLPVVPVTHFVTAKVTGTTIEFVKSSINKDVGVQSFDGDKLDALKPFLICGIALRYAEAAKADNKTVATASYSESAPAQLENGTITLNQVNRGSVIDMLISDAINQNTTNNNLDREFQVADMPLLRDKASFTLEGKTSGELDAAKDHFVRIELRGYSLKS